MTSRRLAVPALLAVCALALAACGTGATAEPDGRIHVVASTSVYGDIAAQIGGDRVAVTSIVTSLAQDPHAYEATARDRLAVSKADLIVANGGGYDAFIDDLAAGADAEILTAAGLEDDHDHDHDHGAEDAHAEHDHAEDGHAHDGNEHVWYDLHAMAFVATELSAHFAELDPDGAAEYEAGADAFLAGLGEVEEGLAALAATHGGARVFVTEPVPVLLLTAAGLENATPAAFSEAVEEGQDVPPAVLLDARTVLASGEVAALIANAQTGGAETSDVIAVARAHGIPVLEFTELLPDGLTYLEWMRQNVDALAAALGE